MKKIFALAFAAVALFGCSNQGKPSPEAEKSARKNIEITNDMENASAVIPSWINEKTVVTMTSPAAHSGQFASLTNDTIEFSYGFQELLKNLHSGVPNHVVLSGWVYSTVEKPNISIILDISEKGQSYKWMPFPLTDKVTEKGKWIEFTTDFYFDKPLNPEQQIKVYAWNLAKKPVYFDDFRLTLEY